MTVNLLIINYSAMTVSIFGFAVSFGKYFNKNRGLRSVSVFMVPDVKSRAQQTLRIRDWMIIGSV